MYFYQACRAENEREVGNIEDELNDDIKSMASTNVSSMCPSYSGNMLNNDEEEVGWENLDAECVDICQTKTTETVKGSLRHLGNERI